MHSKNGLLVCFNSFYHWFINETVLFWFGDKFSFILKNIQGYCLKNDLREKRETRAIKGKGLSITLVTDIPQVFFPTYLVLSTHFFSWDRSIVVLIQKQHHLYYEQTSGGRGKLTAFLIGKKQPWGMKILFCWSQHWKALSKPIRHWYIVSQSLNFELNRGVWGTHKQTWRVTHTNAWKHATGKGGWSHANNSMEFHRSFQILHQ